MKKLKSKCLDEGAGNVVSAMNKKASIFAIALVLITFVSLSYAFGSFIYAKNKIKIAMAPNSEIMDIYQQEIKEKVYYEELLKLLAQEEFNQIAKEGAVSGVDCIIQPEGYIQWNDNCNPNIEELKSRFITETRKNNLKTIEERGDVSYNIEYEYDSSVSLNLEDLGIYIEEFKTIYERAKVCKDDNNVGECMKLKRWKITSRKDYDYVLFDASTKKNFFFGREFEPVNIKFSLKQ